MAYLSAVVKVKDFLRKLLPFFKRPSLYPWYVLSFYTVYFLVTYMTLDKVFALDDHFFHIRFAEILRNEGFRALADFQSIYFSRMGIGHEYLVYYNFLFYCTLVPFSFLSPLVLGIKLYGILALSFSFTSVYLFLRKISVKYSFLWTILFLIVLLQSGWIIRFTLARPFTLAPVFLIWMLYCIHQKKYKWSALIAFLYFYWHTATFIFPLCLAFAYFLFEQFYNGKLDWKKVYWPLIGTISAVLIAYLISPGIVAYLRDVIFPVFIDTALTKTTKIAEGAEVYGSNIFTTLTNFFWFLAALFIAGTYEVWRYIQEKRGVQSTEDRIDASIQPLRAMLFMASIAFFAVTTISARFLDYFVYFCLLYVAVAVTDVSKFFEIRGILFRKAFITGISIIVVFLFADLSLKFYDTLAGSPSHLASQAVAGWLDTHAKEGEVIFNVNWDSFPTLYYFTGNKFRYVTGLEPRFLYDLSPQLYWTWNNIGGGIACSERECAELLQEQEQALSQEDSKMKWYTKQGDLIADIVLRDFKASIIVTSIGRADLLAVMDNSKRFQKEYFDDKNSPYAVYRIVGADEDTLKK